MTDIEQQGSSNKLRSKKCNKFGQRDDKETERQK